MVDGVWHAQRQIGLLAGSIPGTVTVYKKSRIGFVALLVVLVGVVPQAWGSTVSAQESSACGATIPVDALASGTASTGASGTSASLALGSGANVSAGGAGLVASTSAVSGTAQKAAAVLMSAMSCLSELGDCVGAAAGQCVGGFLDWALGDAASWETQELYPSAAITRSGPWECTTLTSPRFACVTFGGSGILPSGGYFPTVNFNGYWGAGPIQRPVSVGPTIPVYAPPATYTCSTYCDEGIRWLSFQGSTTCTGTVTVGERPNCTTVSVGAQTNFTVMRAVPDGTITDYGIGECLGGVPGRITVGIDYSGSGGFATIFNESNTCRDKGWKRQVVTDVECAVPGTGASPSWVQARSAEYFEREGTTRVPMIRCPTGKIPKTTRIWRVPVNWPAQSPGSTTYTTAWKVFEYISPSTWFTGSAPAWVTCLDVSTGCTAPVLNTSTSTCTWGGGSVGGGFCDPTLQTGPNAPAASLQPKLEGDLEPINHTDGAVFTTLEATVAEPPEPPESNFVDIAIDDGDGDRGGLYAFTDDESECWPEGWGWLNPLEWVYRPIKCALLWAFVPDEEVIGAEFDSFVAAAEAQFPFSLMFMLVEFADTLGDELQSASGSGCFDMPGSFSFGSFSTSVDDVCIGDGLSTSSTQRELLAALMIAPMLYALCAHAVRLVRGV